MQATDHQEYADDTILKMETRKIQDITLQLGRYQQVTEGRQIPIQWKKLKY